MRMLLLIGCLLGSLSWMPLAFADYQKTPGTRFDISELHGEFVRASVNFEGASCRDEWGTVICHRDAGDFTDAEKAAMDVALAVHDPDVSAKRKAKRQRDLDSGNAKLKALGLTDDEIAARR